MPHKITATSIATDKEVEISCIPDYFDTAYGYAPEDIKEVLTREEFEGLYKIKE